MENKNGFTLIELIAVITILAVIALITVPVVNKAITKSKEKSLEAQKETIVDAAKKYALANSEILPEYDLGQKLIHISDLVEDGYLEKIPIDPVTDSEMTDCVKVTYDENKNKYTYVYGECKIDITTKNVYPNGYRLLYIYNEDSEQLTTLNDFFDDISIEELTAEDSATLQKYGTENIYGIREATAIIFDDSDIAIDGLEQLQIRIENINIYMDIYSLFFNVVKKYNSDLGYTAMYMFSNPENSIIYLGVSMKAMVAHESPEDLEDIENELSIFSNKNIHTISDSCNALQTAYMSEIPEPTEPFECPFESYSITEFQFDQ